MTPTQLAEFTEKFGQAMVSDKDGGHFIGPYLIEFIEKVEAEARTNAFKEIVALRSGAVYDDYSSLYQHSAEIWIEYAKHESEFLNKQLDHISQPKESE